VRPDDERRPPLAEGGLERGDDRAAKLRAYLRGIANHLTERKAALLAEARSLRASLDQVAGALSAQQRRHGVAVRRDEDHARVDRARRARIEDRLQVRAATRHQNADRECHANRILRSPSFARSTRPMKTASGTARNAAA